MSLDLFGGVRLWRGAEAHVDGLAWQGFGLGKTLGVVWRMNRRVRFTLATEVPRRKASPFGKPSIGLGGEQEIIADSPLQLAGKQDVSRLTVTLGKMSAKDIFDNNGYANDPRTQFMNWALMANEAWDYPADSIGFMTGLALELNVGIFSRVGWSDGENEAWTFADVDRTATLGVSVKGESWHRPNDTYGLAGVVNGISHVHQRFFSAGGTGILAGDGALSYAPEEILETYYDFQVFKNLRAALDYQFVTHPAFNLDRGPVSIFGGRVHWEF